MATYSGSYVRTVTDCLRRFSHNNYIHMGIDELDEKPTVVKYVFYHSVSGLGCMVMVDFELIDDLEITIESCLIALRRRFNLEDN